MLDFPEPQGPPPPAWVEAHSLASIGGDVPWPALTFASDGRFVSISMQGEHRADAAGIRYLRTWTEQVPARELEVAIDRLVDQLEHRLVALDARGDDLRALRRELAEERQDPQLAARCRWLAQAGLDPGEASASWLTEVEALAQVAGESAAGDCLAILPSMGGQPQALRERIVIAAQSSGFVRAFSETSGHSDATRTNGSESRGVKPPSTRRLRPRSWRPKD